LSRSSQTSGRFSSESCGFRAMPISVPR
jgi:hypothetical protein